MKVLMLGPRREALEAILLSGGGEVGCTEAPLDALELERQGWDWLISYGYRHIIRPDVLMRFPARVVNLHISYLPWNRGADPNLWSFLEDTPKGVSIHLVDEGLDTGPILDQREMPWTSGDTLATSYERLGEQVLDLFRDLWPHLRAGKAVARPQPPGGSAHRLKDRARVEHLLVQGWDTPVAALIGKGRELHP